MLPTTAAAAVALAALGLEQLHERSFGGVRLSPQPPTRGDEGSPSRCSRRRREAQSCQPISTVIQQYSLTPTASRKTTRTKKSTRLTIRKRTRRIQSKKSPVKKGRFRLAESDCIGNVPEGPSCISRLVGELFCDYGTIKYWSVIRIRCFGAYFIYLFIYFFLHTFTFQLHSGQAVVTGVVLSPPPVLAFNFYSV